MTSNACGSLIWSTYYPCNEAQSKANKPALGNPLPAPSPSRRVVRNLDHMRRGALGSRCHTSTFGQQYSFQAMTSDPVPVFLAAFNSGSIGGIIVTIICIGLLIWSLRWVYSDAEARGKDGCLVAFLVFLISWPISLLVWMAFRPDLQSLQARHAQNRCSNCNAPIERGRRLCSRCASLA